MDQVKIGNFIANLRREKKMTQKELAEVIGVSDKAISKWECGNGMPEMSMLMPLCQVLKINVNELLSGEKLSEDSYSQKAEENIMNLMQEKEENKKKNKKDIVGAVLVLGVTLCAMLGVIEWTLMIDLGVSGMQRAYYYLIDVPSLIPLLVTASLALCAARLWKPFFRVFGILFSHREYSALEVKESGIALRMVGNVWMLTGILVTLVGLIPELWESFIASATILGMDALPNIMADMLISLAILLLSFFYGVVGKLFLLPIQSKLEVIAEKLTNQE